MILQCPACHARYNVPDRAINTEGRLVRCVKCAHEWMVHASSTEPSAVTPAAPAPAEETLPQETSSPIETPAKNDLKPNASSVIPPISPLLAIGFAVSASAAFLATLLWLMPSIFGLGSIKEVSFADLAFQKQVLDTHVEYAVSGKLVSVFPKAIVPPQIRITLVDKEGNMLQYWEPVMPDRLEPRTPLPFTFGPLSSKFTRGDRLVVEMGNALQLALRGKP